jgi:hypothetical protein
MLSGLLVEVIVSLTEEVSVDVEDIWLGQVMLKSKNRKRSHLSEAVKHVKFNTHQGLCEICLACEQGSRPAHSRELLSHHSSSWKEMQCTYRQTPARRSFSFNSLSMSLL